MFSMGEKLFSVLTVLNDFTMITAPANRLKAAIFFNKRPMGYIAHVSNNSHNKISLMKLYTKHLCNVVE